MDQKKEISMATVIKWEYFVEARNYKMLADELNKYGNEGWELFSVIQEPCRDISYIIYYFKRSL